MRWRAAGDLGATDLKRTVSLTDLRVHKITHSEFQCLGSSSKITRYIWGGAELTSFKMKAEGQSSGQLSPWMEVLADATVFFELSSNSASRCRLAPSISTSLTWLTLFSTP